MGNDFDDRDPDVIQEDLTGVGEVEDFSPVPAGRYLCRIIDVQTTKKDGTRRVTRAGDKQWGLRLEPAAVLTAEGKLSTADPHKVWSGRSCWDNLTHSAAAAKRRKLLLSRLGIDVTRPFTLTPELLIGRWALMTFELEKIQVKDKKSGNMVERLKNTVPFAGYEAAPVNAVEAIVKAGKAPKLVSERAKEESEFGYGANAAS